ncbi:methyltransferase, FkbM family [Rhodobacteraceae bacterium KLH11]|nr:methyltransferase, FkbM family [Rhodobacteraceae bacterium KLH11]
MLIKARKMFYRARGYCHGNLNGEPFRLDPYHSKFWRKASEGRWEPETFNVLDQHLSPERDYLDIGAWIGPTVLYAARRARHVWCFEPDPVAYRHLVWNLELNNIRNVSAFSVALSEDFGVTRMASAHGEAGDSTSSLLHDGSHGTDALTMSWDQFSASVDLTNVSLVKMDIEGAEFAVLPSLLPWLRKVNPALFLSTHAPYLNSDNRAAAMDRLSNDLAFYRHCRDPFSGETGKPALTGERALTQFPTFLFNTRT